MGAPARIATRAFGQLKYLENAYSLSIKNIIMHDFQ
jgi:hypothetical protein